MLNIPHTTRFNTHIEKAWIAMDLYTKLHRLLANTYTVHFTLAHIAREDKIWHGMGYGKVS